MGHLKQDWDGLIPVGKITHYLGDAVALVAAETPELVEKAKKLIKVEYEELPMVRDPYEAMKEDAPLVHEDGNLLAHWHVHRGDAEKPLPDPPMFLQKNSGHRGQSMRFWSRSALWQSRTERTG